MKKRLRDILPKTRHTEEEGFLCNSYDIIGDIAVIRLTEYSAKYGQEAAEAIMSIHRNVSTVLAQIGGVVGDLRLRQLTYITGEDKTMTTHSEHGCTFRVDLKSCYFSPRLSYERMRIAGQVGHGETVVNLFAGVGCFSLIIARHSEASKVYSIDVNPVAFQFMKENVRINGTYGRVVPILGDAEKVAKDRLCRVADRVLLPLPEKALSSLLHANLALKRQGGWIHYYGFEHAAKNEDPIEKAKLKVAGKMNSLGVKFSIPFGRVVRSTGPNWHQIAFDISVG